MKKLTSSQEINQHFPGAWDAYVKDVVEQSVTGDPLEEFFNNEYSTLEEAIFDIGIFSISENDWVYPSSNDGRGLTVPTGTLGYSDDVSAVIWLGRRWVNIEE